MFAPPRDSGVREQYSLPAADIRELMAWNGARYMMSAEGDFTLIASMRQFHIMFPMAAQLSP